MSRIGKRIIGIPEKTEVIIQNGEILVKGPKGELRRPLRPEIDVVCENNEVKVMPLRKGNFSNAIWGTYSSHISNMIEGVNTPFQKKLIIEGVGYKSELKGDTIVMALGFSHPVIIKIPSDINLTIEKNVISITGINKESVGEFSAKIRGMKKPEPYKGKGIRYSDEVVRRKQGKKSA